MVPGRWDSWQTQSTPAARLHGKTLPVLLLVFLAVGVPLYGAGVIVPADVLAVLFLPVLWSTVFNDRWMVALWLTSLAWGSAQLLSNRVHGLEFVSGVSLLGPTVALLVTALVALHRRAGLSSAQIVLAAAGGWLVLTLLTGDIWSRGNPWKYGLSTPITLVALSAASLMGLKRGAQFALLMILAGISLACDSRGVLGLVIACGVVLAVLGPESGKQSSNWRRGTSVGVGSTLVAALVALYVVYPIAADNGILGERASVQQALYNAEGINFLMGNRPEFSQTAYLVAQNLPLGIGSYAPLSTQEAYGALSFVDQNVLPLDVNSRAYLLNEAAGGLGYNAHSAALSAILYAGFLAAPFWLFLIASLLRGFRGIVARSMPEPIVATYALALLGWDALFSPLYAGSQLELSIGLFLCMSVFRTRARSSSREDTELLVARRFM